MSVFANIPSKVRGNKQTTEKLVVRVTHKESKESAEVIADLPTKKTIVSTRIVVRVGKTYTKSHSLYNGEKVIGNERTIHGEKRILAPRIVLRTEALRRFPFVIRLEYLDEVGDIVDTVICEREKWADSTPKRYSTIPPSPNGGRDYSLAYGFGTNWTEQTNRSLSSNLLTREIESKVMV